jgi:RNA polymerase sigma-70 factor (ECF subfamily)
MAPLKGSIEQLYARYGRSVLRRARAILRDDEAAKDALQEVFLRAFRSGGALEPNPLGWLYRSTTNLCLNRLRDSRRRGEILSTWLPEGDDGSNVEQRVVASRILQRVPAELQEIAVYYYLDGLSHEEIASITGMSRRTIGNRLSEFHATVDTITEKEGAL